MFFHSSNVRYAFARCCSNPSIDRGRPAVLPVCRTVFCGRQLHRTLPAWFGAAAHRYHCFAMTDFRFGVFDSLQFQIQFILVPRSPFVFRSTIGQDPQKRNTVCFKEGKNPVIEEFSSCYCMFRSIEFGKSHPGVGVDKGLLINTAYALDIAHIVGILGTLVAGMLRFYLTMNLLLFFLPFQCNQLRFRQDDTILGNTGFLGLEALGEGFQIMSLQYTTNTGSRDENTLLTQFIAGT